MEGKFQIDFKTDNAAFEDNPREAQEILLKIVRRLDAGEVGGCIYDDNGNNIGQWGFY
jgi:hypothetical protein